MRKLGNFDIPFTGLKLGNHQYQFEIDKAFFDQFEFSEIGDAHFKVDLVLEKQSTMQLCILIYLVQLTLFVILAVKICFYLLVLKIGSS